MSVAYQAGASVCPQCGSSTDVRTARELFDMMNGARGQAFQRLSEQFGFPGSASGPGQYPEQGQPPDPAQSASEGWSAAGGQSASAGGAPGQGQAPGYGQFPGGNHFPVQDYFGQSASQDRQAAQGQSPGPGQPAGAGDYAGQEQPPVQQQFPGQGQAPDQGQSGGGSQPPSQGQFPWRRRRNSDDDYVEGPDPRLRGNRSGRDSDFFSGDNIVDDIGGAVMGAALGFAGRAIGRRMMKALEDKVVPAVQARAGLAQQQLQQQKGEQDAIVARYPELRGCTKDQVIFLDGGMRTVPVSELQMPVTLAQADQVVARLR
jgi:hypothetical protein